MYSNEFEPLTIFVNRMKKLGIKLQLVGNYPWIYIDKINGIEVKEKLSSEYGFTIGWLPVRRGEIFYFNDMSKIFKLIRRYTKEEYRTN